MTDQDLVSKKLAFMETCLRELRALAQPDLLESDLKERRFAEHTLQVCIQAMQDISSHVVSAARLGEPASNIDLLSILAREKWIEQTLSLRLKAAVGFRNILVHGYTAVDPLILKDVLQNRLGDMDDFVRSIRERLGG